MDNRDIFHEQAMELRCANGKAEAYRLALANSNQLLQNAQAASALEIAALQQQLYDAQQDAALQNTISKLEKFEQDIVNQRREIYALRSQLDTTTKQLRVAQTTPSTNENQLKRELESAKAENARLKTTSESLQRQLQAEKRDNAGRLGFMASGKDRDQDDEEPLPTMRRPSSTPRNAFETSQVPATPAFKYPTPLPNVSRLNASPIIVRKPDPVQPTPKVEKKRKRTQKEQIDEELNDLHLDTFEAPARPRKKRAAPSFEDPDSEHFSFKAVCTYKDGEIDHYFTSEDLNECKFLQDRIEMTKDKIWEKDQYSHWQFAIKADCKSKRAPCVTKKLAHQRTSWHKGFEGVFACRDCAKNGRPCFIWVEDAGYGGMSDGEFRLLPLRDADRTRPIVPGKTEVRYWINDDTNFEDSDVLKLDEGDDEYVD